MKIPKDEKITFLFLSWRDIKAPKKGGAEVFTHEMLKRVSDKYRIIHISPLFEGASKDEMIDAVRYIRGGGTLSVINFARKFYKENKNNINYVVDQCNTHRFFTKFWIEKEKRIFFIHQFTREIWYMNSKFPVSFIGAVTETPFMKLSKNDYTITVSNSTRDDLIDVGFDKDKVYILPEGIDFKHWKKSEFLKKEENPTFIYVGRYVNYKGIDDTVEAFGKIKGDYPKAKLWLVGKKKDQYIEEKLKPIFEKYNLSWGEEMDKDVVIHGFVSDERKLELMSRATALVFPSQREGWGLIMTEAAAVGTPSIAYNSPGIVDAVNNGKAGYLCESNSPNSIYELMKRVIENKEGYSRMRDKAYDYSLNFHWDNTGKAFIEFVDEIRGK